MRRFRIVARQEFLEAIRSTPFKVITVFLLVTVLLAGAAAFLLDLLMSGGSEGNIPSDGGIHIETDFFEQRYTNIIAVEDRSGMGLAGKLADEMPLLRFDTMQLSEDAIIKSVNDKECDAYIIINGPLDFVCYESDSMYGDSYAPKIARELARINSVELLGEHGVSGADVSLILDAAAVYEIRHTGGGYDMGKYLFNLVMVVMMFMVISLYGQMVANRVATEKSSRTMEVLATSVSPVELLCGKVAGVGAAGLGQILMFFFVIVFILRSVLKRIGALDYMMQGVSFSALDVLWLALYFILGFLIIAFIYGGLGSMVSQVEDLSGLSSLPMGVFMIGYFIAITATMTGRTNILLRVGSFVPFWSPMVMFSRMSVEEVPVWQILVSLALLAATSALFAVLSARLYRAGMLRYGKPPKLKEIIGALKKHRA